MGTTHGKNGVIKEGAVVIAELQNWTLEENADLGEDTQSGDTDKTFLVGIRSWNAGFEVNYDPADAGQAALTIGAGMTFSFYPAGTGAGMYYRTGAGIVEKISEPFNRSNVNVRSFTVRGNGQLTRTTV